MLRVAVLGAVMAVSALAGCGEDSSSDRGGATTAASARDHARQEDREGLRLIRRVPLIEARHAIESEAAR
jgi:hypothetical protein